MTTIHIKNMCCPRCISAVRAILASMHLTAHTISLGEAEIEEALTTLQLHQLSEGEIASTLGYSSPAHLTSQFKQLTGMSPKAFRDMDNKKRKCLDEI